MFDFLSQKFSGILQWMTKKSSLTESNIQEALDQVKQALIDADVPLAVVNDFLSTISQEVVGTKLQGKTNPGNMFIKIVHDKLLTFLGGNEGLQTTSFQIPSVTLVMGLQGSGKTTTLAKLAHWIKKEAAKKNKTRRILVASVDFYRPAAIDQLEILARNADVAFFRAPSTDAKKAAHEILAHFKQNNFELLFLDTAGRLHIDENLMQELKEVAQIVQPKHSFLVLDAMTGQESLNVAQAFNTAIGFQAAILTKMDSETRGGACFAFRYVMKKPIAFVGSGEKLDDIEAFIPERVATSILGMGDIVSLVEKTEEIVAPQDQEAMVKKLLRGDFTLVDFESQLNMMAKMGPLQKLVKYLPGAGQVSQEQLDQSQIEMKQFRAILGSMTAKEKDFPQLLGADRKRRIAKGSGTKVEIINQLLQKFEQSKQFVTMLKKVGKKPPFFR